MHSSSKKVYEQIKDTEGVKIMMETYQQMAAQKMLTIRKNIEKTAEYYQGLSDLSVEIGVDVDQHMANQKEMIVLITADSGLYGQLLESVFRQFALYVTQQKNPEVWIIGEVGVQMTKLVLPNIKFQTLDATTDTEKYQKLVDVSIGKKIVVFHGEYKNMAYQEVEMSNLRNLKTNQKNTTEIITHYFYEPSLENVAGSFADQITSGLISFTINKADLAMAAARVIHLDKSLSSIEEKTKLLNRAFASTKKKAMQKKTSHQLMTIKIRSKKK